MSTHDLPDVTADDDVEIPSTLQWVGMEGIAVPIAMNVQNDRVYGIPAKANAFVSLDEPDAKGIHMSRIHMIINRLADLECDRESIHRLLDDMVSSQGGISQRAKIELSFELVLKKQALLSAESGFQAYPITLIAQKDQQGYNTQFVMTIPYSSTCPCSASLARQLYAKAIDEAFNEPTIDKSTLLAWIQSQAGSVATPHNQRSYAYIRLSLGSANWPEMSSLIFQFEEIIGTPVQTVVKRSDEQEFARLNASHLMFCEDAARLIKDSLEQMSSVKDYWLKVEHQESLHAHNAVVIDSNLKLGASGLGNRYTKP